MIIEKKDLGEGLVRVRTQTLDDLWHLEKVLEPGDLLTARTLRKAVIKRGSEIKEGDRVPLTPNRIRLQSKVTRPVNATTLHSKPNE